MDVYYVDIPTSRPTPSASLTVIRINNLFQCSSALNVEVHGRSAIKLNNTISPRSQWGDNSDNRATASFAISTSRCLRSQLGENDVSGRQLPGIPRSREVALAARTEPKLYFCFLPASGFSHEPRSSKDITQANHCARLRLEGSTDTNPSCKLSVYPWRTPS